jgi:hypothetical protein
VAVCDDARGSDGGVPVRMGFGGGSLKNGRRRAASFPAAGRVAPLLLDIEQSLRLEKNLVNTERIGVLAIENEWDFDR